MKINASRVGKRFNTEWIFRGFSFQFESGRSYAITGPNGSGKSTLLQIIAGATIFNEGTIEYSDGLKVKEEEVYKCVSIAAPYLELVEEMTLLEFLTFHTSLKNLLDGVSIHDLISFIGLNKAADKQIRYFSSGMKQRVKLGQAVFSDVPVVLLDEPATNLDTDGIDLYHRMVEGFCRNRLVIVSSNDKTDYNFCHEVIDIGQYKPA